MKEIDDARTAALSLAPRAPAELADTSPVLKEEPRCSSFVPISLTESNDIGKI